MKKKSIFMVIFLIAVATMSLMGCEKDDVNELNEYYRVSGDKPDDYAALFFLGTDMEQVKANGQALLEKHGVSVDYAASVDFEMVNVDNGNEYYLILPKYEDTEIKVYSTKLTEEGTLVADKELESTDDPVGLRCNLSDITPSAQVTVTHSGKTITFNPSISLKDGTLADIPNIYTEQYQ